MCAEILDENNYYLRYFNALEKIYKKEKNLKNIVILEGMKLQILKSKSNQYIRRFFLRTFMSQILIAFFYSYLITMPFFSFKKVLSYVSTGYNIEKTVFNEILKKAFDFLKFNIIFITYKYSNYFYFS